MTDRRDRAGMPSYSLGELTERAGVTVRTVRYYIAEGLLPPPVGAGPQARYTREHLDRLRLIARMKDAYLPLKEIRRRLQAMSDEEIASAAETGAPAGVAMAAPESAADYIGHVLHERAAPRYDAPAPPPPRRQPQQPDRAWRRLPVTEEAELLITDEALRRRGEQIEAAIDWLRRILDER